MMQLIIRGSVGHVLDVSSDSTVAALKHKLAELEGAQEVNLFCAGAPVEVALHLLLIILLLLFLILLLQDCVNVSYLEGQTLDLTLPLRGGKVHGSLARAGKVPHSSSCSCSF